MFPFLSSCTTRFVDRHSPAGHRAPCLAERPFRERPGGSPSGIPSAAIIRSRSFSQFQPSFRAAPRWVPAPSARLPMTCRGVQGQKLTPLARTRRSPRASHLRHLHPRGHYQANHRCSCIILARMSTCFCLTINTTLTTVRGGVHKGAPKACPKAI